MDEFKKEKCPHCGLEGAGPGGHDWIAVPSEYGADSLIRHQYEGWDCKNRQLIAMTKERNALLKALENHPQFDDGTYITEGSEVFIVVGDQIYRKEYSLEDQFGESPWLMVDKKYKSLDKAEASMYNGD